MPVLPSLYCCTPQKQGRLSNDADHDTGKHLIIVIVSCPKHKAHEHLMFCDMNYFEELLEKERLRELDRQYFSCAENARGSQYCDDFESISGIVGSGGFGFIKLSKPKKKNQV